MVRCHLNTLVDEVFLVAALHAAVIEDDGHVRILGSKVMDPVGCQFSGQYVYGIGYTPGRARVHPAGTLCFRATSITFRSWSIRSDWLRVFFVCICSEIARRSLADADKFTCGEELIQFCAGCLDCPFDLARARFVRRLLRTAQGPELVRILFDQLHVDLVVHAEGGTEDAHVYVVAFHVV